MARARRGLFGKLFRGFYSRLDRIADARLSSRRWRSRHTLAKAVIETLEPRILLSSNTYVVTTLTDSNATGTLRNAISLADTAANAGSNTDIQLITFESGLSGTLTLNGSALGIIHTHGEVYIDGPGENALTIDANGESQVFSTASHPNSSIEISSLTITGGYIPSGGPFGTTTFGAGIDNVGNLTINNSVITGNSGYSYGGGIYIAGGTVTISNSSIIDNTTHGDGGGIASGGEGGGGNLTLENSTVSNNTAGPGGGGGVFLNGGNDSFTDSTIGNNTGDGIQAFGGTLAITGSTIDNNSNAGVSTKGHITLTNSTINNNSGFGFFSTAGGAPTPGGSIINSTLTGNTGGGIYTDLGDELTVVDSTVSGNSLTSGSGAGITDQNDVSTHGSVLLEGTIVANNVVGNSESDLSGAFTGSYNLIGDGSVLTVGSNENIDGSANLGTLGFYGGPTETMALLPGSTAIGAGSNFETTDQRGFERPSSAIDIGAFQTEPPPTLTISGASSIAAGSSYTLSLSAVFPTLDNSLDNIQSWTINWGDGTAQAPDTQTVYGNPSSVVHSFSTQAGAYSITAAATDDLGTYAALGGGSVSVTVTGGSPLQIIGPNAGTTNSSIQLQATGGNVSGGTDPLTYTWDVTESGAAVTSGTGPTFAFTPETTGAYLVTVIAIGDPAGPSAATDSITITAAQDNVIPIQGPSTLEVGRDAAFGFNEATVLNFFGAAQVNQWLNEVINTSASTAGPAINWVISQDGTVVDTAPTAYFFYNDGDSSQPPADIFFSANSTGSYSVSLQISYDGKTLFQNAETLQAVLPAEHNFVSTVLPAPSTVISNSTYEAEDSLMDAVVQSDGKILIVGEVGFGSSAVGNAASVSTWAITRLNPDLTVDASFGNNGTVVTTLPGTIFNATTFFMSRIVDSNIHVAVDPEGRILVALSVNDTNASNMSPEKTLATDFSSNIFDRDAENGDTIWVVARYLSDGTRDSSFGTGGIAQEESPALDELQTMALGADGQIYLGGEGYMEAQSPLDPSWPDGFGGEASQSLPYRPCFVVMCVDSDGDGLSQSFGNAGLSGFDEADQSTEGLDFIPVGSDSQVQYPGYDYDGDLVGPIWGSESATSIIVEPNGGLIVGGFTSQISDAFTTTGDFENWTYFSPTTLGPNPPLTGFALVRLTSDGSLDDTFGDYVDGDSGPRTGKTITYFPDFNDAWLRNISLNSEGDIIAMGTAGPMWAPYNATGDNFALAAYDSTGLLDTSFGANSDGLVTFATGVAPASAFSGVITDTGEIILSGTSESGDGVIAAFAPNGATDTLYFGSDTNDSTSPADFEPTIPGSNYNIFSKIISLPNNDLLMIGPGYSGDYSSDNGGAPPDCDEIVVAEYTPQVLKVGNLAATATPSGPIDLEWQNLGSGQDGFEILRSTSDVDDESLGSPTTVVGYAGADQTTFTDSSALPDTTYYYEVVAYGTNPTTGAIVPGGHSNIASASTAPLDASYVLEGIVGVDLTGTMTTSTFNLTAGSYYELVASGYFDLGGPGGTYTADAEYAWYTSGTPHNIEPGQGGVDYGIAAWQGGSPDQPAVSSLKTPYWGPVSSTADHSYTISFEATENGAISFSYFDDYYPDNAALTYPMQVAIYVALPSSPGNLTTTPDRTDKQINLSWTDESSDDGSIVVQRAAYEDGTLGAFTTIATLPNGSTSFSDPVSSSLSNSIAYNQEYAYQVYCQTSVGPSGPSNTAYAVLVNKPPQVTAIPTQVAYVGSEFQYSVSATDPQDGTTGLTYSITGGPTGLTFVNPANDTADSQSPDLTGWMPTQAELDSYFDDESWQTQLTVTDAEGSSTTVPMLIQVAPPTSAIPHTDDGGVAAHVVSQTPTTITLSVSGVDSTSNDGSDISYTWETISQPAQAGTPIFSVNGTNAASETVATVYGAGTYDFKVVMNNGNGWPGASEVTANVTQELGGISVTPILSAVVANSTTSVELTAQAVDQFGYSMISPPTFTWSIDSGSHAHGSVMVSGSSSAIAYYSPPTSVSGTLSDLVDVTAAGYTGEPGSATVTVTVNADTAPVINSWDANPSSFSQLQLLATPATDSLYPGTDSHLIYTWQLTPTSGNTNQTGVITFSDNGSNSAKKSFATLPTGAIFDYVVTLTVTNSLGQSTSDTLTLSDIRDFSQIAVTSTTSTPVSIINLGEGGSVTLDAVAEDQYSRPVTPSPTLDWSLDSGTTTTATGSSYTYTAPNMSGDYTVEVFSGSVSENLTIDVAPPGNATMDITSPHAAPGSPPTDINSTTDVNIVSYNPDGAAAPWSLWLLQQNAPTGTLPIELASSNQSTDQYGDSSDVAAINPAAYANGIYELELEDGSGNVKDSTLVSIDSQLKLGNLTLPITDLTVNPPGSPSLTATRTYDSSQANEDANSLGYGWQINLTGTNFHTTVQTVQGDSSEYPGFADGDLVYITLPNGQQHVFAFEAKFDSSIAGEDDGISQDVTYFAPNFVCVDGSGATLTVSTTELSGDDEPFPIALEEINGEYIDAVSGKDYNPAYSVFDTDQNTTSPTYGDLIDYTLATTDGTTYVVDPTDGNIVSAKDANGNAINYTSTFTKQTDPTTGQITSLSDPAGQTVQYAYDNNQNLIGVVSPVGPQTSYQYGDELLVPYIGLTTPSIYAVITNTTEGPDYGKIWNNNSGGGWTTTASPLTYAIGLDQTSTTISTHDQWFYLTAPAIAAGTSATVKYYVQASSSPAGTDTLIYTDNRTWSTDGAHQMTGIIDPSGVKALTATYVDASGQLASLQQTNEKSSPVTTGPLDGTESNNTGDNNGQAVQTVTDSAGDTTEDYYDPEGDVVRKIQTLKDANGNTTGYEVTVTNYDYFTDPGDPQDTGSTYYNMLIDETAYQPFETTTLSAAESDAGSVVQQSFDYYVGQGGHPDSDLGKLISETDNLGNGLTQVTSYSDYVDGKPENVSVQIMNGTTDVGPEVNTNSHYDATTGNLLWSQDSTGQYTVYTYTDGSDGIPAGQVLDTYRGTSSNETEDLLTSSNTYYSNTTASLGSVTGMLASSIIYDYTGSGEDAVQSNQTTYYAYDSLGDQILSYSPKTWYTSSGTAENGWNVTTTEYNEAGQQVSTSQAAYVGTGSLDFTVGSESGTTGVVTVNTSVDAIYVDSTQTTSTSGSPLTTSHTDYNAAGQVADTTDQYGQKTYSIYDINGNVVDTLYPNGTEVRTVYDSLGRVILQTDRYATDTTVNSTTDVVTYDNTTVAPLATMTLYNSLGQAYSTQEYRNVLVTMSADTIAPTTSGIEIATAPTGLTPQSTNFISYTQTWFDDQGRAIETKNAAGLRTGTIYYSNGQVEYTGPLNASTPDGGETNATTDVTSFQLSDLASYTQYLYDQVDTSTDNPWSGKVYNETIDADGHWTKTFADSQGRTIFIVNEDESYTQTVYSVGDQAITSASLPTGVMPPSGLVVPEGGSETATITEANGDLVATFDVYDAAGNLTDVWQPPVADALNGGAMTSPHTHYDYDASGNEIDQIDAKGNETTFAYDENGNQVRETLPSPEGTTAGATESSTFDQFGRVLTHTDFEGNVTAYTYYSSYDSGAYLGNVEQIAYTPVGGSSPDETVTYSYDSLGREDMVTDVTSAGTRVDTYTYDPITGQQTSAATPEGTVNHSYDPATGLLIRTWTSDEAEDETFAYNALSQLQTVTVTELDGHAVDQVTTYTYDAVGNLASTTTNTGSATIIATYTYDDLNRLTKLVNTNGSGQVLGSYTYTLDADGNRTQVVEIDSTGATRTVDYQYDADGRLTEEKVIDSTGNHTTDYAYDLVGNRITQTDSTGTTTFTYNGDDELTAETLPTSSAIDYTYDANGSETGESGGVSATYVYDDRNRLISATVSGTTQTYKYDDNGDRVSMTTGGATTLYEVDDHSISGYPQVAAEINASTSALIVGYAWGQQLIAADRGGTSSFYLYDGHGSVRALTSVTAAVTDTYTYNAFGVLLSSTGSTVNPYGFAMMRSDGATGMYYDNARYYIAPLDRFNQMDSLGYGNNADPITLHKYLYADVNPANMVDPSGHGALDSLLVAMGMVAGLIATYAIPVVEVASPYLGALALVTFATDPEAAQEFLATGGDPEALIGDLVKIPGLVADDARSLLVFGQGLLQDAKTLGIGGQEVNALRGAVSNAIGTFFEQEVVQALGQTETNAQTYAGTTNSGATRNAVPDLPVGPQYGVTEIKSSANVTNTPQLQAEASIAKRNNKLPFNLIISPDTNSISGPVIQAIDNSGGNVFQFNPDTNTWTTINLPDNGPWKRE